MMLVKTEMMEKEVMVVIFVMSNGDIRGGGSSSEDEKILGDMVVMV